MSKKFIQMTSGWIPVSLLVLFAAAFALGPARAGMPAEDGPKADEPSLATVTVVVDQQMLEHLQVLPMVADALLNLPQGIEVRFDAGQLRGNDGESDREFRGDY